MILANFVTDFFNGLAIVGALSILGIYLVVAAIVLIARHMGDDYRRQGGLPGLTRKATAHTAGHFLKRAIKNWFTK
jgi:Na+/glutamate symporter